MPQNGDKIENERENGIFWATVRQLDSRKASFSFVRNKNEKRMEKFKKEPAIGNFEEKYSS